MKLKLRALIISSVGNLQLFVEKLQLPATEKRFNRRRHCPESVHSASSACSPSAS